jgi:CBS domain-containing protein
MRHACARDIMSSPVITAKPKQTLQDLARTIFDERISGIPVVDEDNTLVGIVSKTDLIAFELERQIDQVYEVDLKLIFKSLDDGSSPTAETLTTRTVSQPVTVQDIMNTKVVTAGPDSRIADIADKMRELRLHRVVIVDKGHVAGMVTSMDLLKIISNKNISFQEKIDDR